MSVRENESYLDKEKDINHFNVQGFAPVYPIMYNLNTN